MNLLEKIKNIFRKKTPMLPAADETIIGTEKNKNEQYRETLFKETKEKMESFEGLSKQELEDKILRAAGVNNALINNPQARKIMVSSMGDVGMRSELGLHIEGTDKNAKVVAKIYDDSASTKDVSESDAVRSLIEHIKNSWTINDNGIECRSFFGNFILKSDGKKVTILQRDSYSNHPIVVYQDRIHTYTVDGLELSNEFWEQNRNEGLKLLEKLERESIDKAKLTTKNGEKHYVNLATDEGGDIAELHFVHERDGSPRPDFIYPESIDGEAKAVQSEKVKRKIEESKFKMACNNYIKDKGEVSQEI